MNNVTENESHDGICLATDAMAAVLSLVPKVELERDMNTSSFRRIGS